MLNFLLADRPEALYFINFIYSFEYLGIPLPVIFGVLFLISSAILFALLIFGAINEKKYPKIQVILILIFWTPTFAGSLYNNIYDSAENAKIISNTVAQKRIMRYCSIDYYYEMRGTLCKFLSFIKFTKDKLPAHSTYTALTAGGLGPYLGYYLFPEPLLQQDITKADYLVVYHDNRYYMQNDLLFARGSGKKMMIDEIKKFRKIYSFGQDEYIFKRIK